MRSVAELEERLSRPRPALLEDLSKLDGDILVLGAGGKLGPSLVRLALRGIREAGTGARVIAVSRFSEPGLAESLRADGAEVVAADVNDVAALPDAENVIFLVGAKFGTTGAEHATWATNTYLPGLVARRYADARIVALSTGNVYPLVPVVGGGATEDTPPDPVGEYAMSCLGRERLFEHFANRLALIRLNYAVELRYGVLVDLARAARVDLAMGAVNVVWQGYANEVTLRCLPHADSPPFVLNVTGPETASVRHLAHALGSNPEFVGVEADTALLANAAKCHRLFGYPDVSLGELVEWTRAWVAGGLPVWDKPTKFARRDGRF